MPQRIAVTAGEPAGIGPDIIIQLAQQPQLAELVVVGSPELLTARAKLLGLPLTLREFKPAPAVALPAGHLSIYPVELAEPDTPGRLNPANSQYVLQTITTAVELCLEQQTAAMVTAPVHKGIINDAGHQFTGHTEFLCALTNAKLPVMMLCNESFRVALATTHLPLKDVSAAISKESLQQVIRILNQDLQIKFGITTPRILVCGLNPHAGESGHLGREEIEIIAPTLEQLRTEGIELTGPLPADTLFTPKYLEQHDAVLAMYHDQGLPVLKYAGFGESINVTLGLPIIRTSVDHGTALDLAGTGKASHQSLGVAIALAMELAKQQA